VASTPASRPGGPPGGPLGTVRSHQGQRLVFFNLTAPPSAAATAKPWRSIQPSPRPKGGLPSRQIRVPDRAAGGQRRLRRGSRARARASSACVPGAERARGRTPALVPSQAPLPAERSRRALARGGRADARGLERPYPHRGRAAAYPRAMSRTPHADACWEPARVPRGHIGARLCWCRARSPHRSPPLPVQSAPRRGCAARAVMVGPRRSLRLAASCQGFATGVPYPRRSAPWHVRPRARRGRWASRMARVGSLHGPVHEPHGSM
jgi:hypothetical protein